MTPARSPIGPTGAAERDLVHEAEVEFLTALAEGRRLEPYCGRISGKDLTAYEHNAALDAMRAIDKARQRFRKAGRAFWQSPRWSITPEGRAWLAALPTPPGDDGGRTMTIVNRKGGRGPSVHDPHSRRALSPNTGTEPRWKRPICSDCPARVRLWDLASRPTRRVGGTEVSVSPTPCPPRKAKLVKPASAPEAQP